MTPQERIKADAEKAIKIKNWGESLQIEMYIAGATAEHDRAKVLVDALEQAKIVISLYKDLYNAAQERACLQQINEALEQWKSGKGKEQPAKPIEYMPVHPEDARKFDCPKQFPMHLLDEDQAMSNHSQSLKRLKERGGLSVHEMIAVANKKPWSYYSKLPWAEALKMLNDIVITNPQK